jgi:hypothetical protein
MKTYFQHFKEIAPIVSILVGSFTYMLRQSIKRTDLRTREYCFEFASEIIMNREDDDNGLW